MQKRMIAILLALVMVMSLLPMSVWAEDEGTTVGTMENPAELTLGINTAVIEEGSFGYYYNWVAEEDCILQINMPELTEENGLTGWQYYLLNLTTFDGGESHYSSDDPVVSTAAVEVAAGDVIELCVCTYDPANPEVNPAGEVSVEVLTTYPQGSVNSPIFLSGDAVITIPAGKTMYYAGRFGGQSMSAVGTGVTLEHNGQTYVLSDEATVFECYQESQNNPSSFVFTNTTEADVEVTLKLIVPVGTYENPAELALGQNTFVIEEGNDQGYYVNWTAEEDCTLYLVMPTDADWQYTVNDMTNYKYGTSRNSGEGTDSNPAVVQVSDGTQLQIIFNSFDPADVNHYPGVTLEVTALLNCVHDYSYTVEASGQHTGVCAACLLTVTEKHTYSDGVCVCGEEEPAFYTVYFQNNWMWTDVYAYYWGSDADPVWPGVGMTPYGTDNGYDIYVCQIPSGITGLLFNGLKDDGSGNRDQCPDVTDWYEGACYYMVWDEANSCNAYGSYDVATAEGMHVHTLDEGVVTAPTCTEGGYTTYTCADCADDETTEELENTFVGNWTGATGHAYVDGVCANCGEAEPDDVTVYCINSKNWGAVNAYVWHATGNNSWPGVAMELTEETVNDYAVYALTFSKAYVNIIFNNGSGSQTSDLTVMEGQYYDLQTNTWYESLEDVPEVDPLSTNVYLAGSFNAWNIIVNEFKLVSADATTATLSLELEANTTYEFKVVNDGTWTSNATAITGTVEGLTFSSSVGGNATITTGEAGIYVFGWDTVNSTLSVTYPAAHEHDYTYTDNGDDTHTASCGCGDSVTEGHTYTDGVCVCGAKEAAEGISGTDVAVTEEAPVVVEYTAQTKGVLSVTISGNPGYEILVTDPSGETVGLPKTSKTEQTVTYDLTAGNTYTITMYAYNTSAWARVDGTVSYSIIFTPAEEGGESEKAEYEVDYENALVLGDNDLTLLDTAITTIYYFTPEEVGTYTFTAPEGAILGIWGYNWVNGDPGSTTNTCEWTCTSIGQSIMIGVSGVEGAFVLNVAKTDEYNPIVYTEVVYQNKAELSAYTLPRCAVLGEYVDVTEEHSAVLGEDGYYHLDSADGPILLMDLNYEGIVLSDKLRSDIPTMNLYTDQQLEDGSYIKYDIKYAIAAIDEKGELSELYNAEYDMVSYEDVMSEDGYYPLTEDLILFYKDYATAQGVWSFYLTDVEYNAETVWMYCCRTMDMAHDETVHVEEKEPTCVETGNIEYWYCADCGAAWLDAECTLNTNLLAVVLPMAEHNYENGTCTVCGEAEPVELIEWYGSSSTLGGKLALNFYIESAKLSELTDAYVVITRTYADGSVDTKTIEQADWVKSGSYYKFTYSDIAAKEMGDVVSAVIYNANGTAVTVIREDSIATWALRVLDAYADETKTCTMCVDLLNYGAAAQTYFGYNAENLVNAKLTAEQKALATAEAETVESIKDGQNLYGTSLVLEEEIQLKFYFNVAYAEGMTAKATFTDHYGNEKVVELEAVQNGTRTQVVVNALAIADYKSAVTCELYSAEGNVVAWGVDGMASNISRQVDEAWLVVCDAIMKLGASSYAYFHK